MPFFRPQVLRPLGEVLARDAEHHLSLLQLQAVHEGMKNGDPDPDANCDPARFNVVAELQKFLDKYRRCPVGGGSKGSDIRFPDL